MADKKEPWTMFGYNSREDLESALNDAERLGYLRGRDEALAERERLAGELLRHENRDVLRRGEVGLALLKILVDEYGEDGSAQSYFDSIASVIGDARNLLKPAEASE